MERNKRQKKIADIQSAQQHVVMLHEPYPLIYNEETGEPAIQIGTLNFIECTSPNPVMKWPHGEICAF